MTTSGLWGIQMVWDDLQFWSSEAWQQTQEALDVLEGKFNPKRENLFAALDACPLESCKVCILGQDPYPDAAFATGIAFSIPPEQKKFPPTLINIFKEYVEDLHYPFPGNGDLSPWCSQGVLLWNVVPTCETGKPGSHRGWVEWNSLTREIVEVLDTRGVLFVTLGGIARTFPFLYSKIDTNKVLSYSHPSPLGVGKGKSPFSGSRLFSTINSYITPAIDWRL